MSEKYTAKLSTSAQEVPLQAIISTEKKSVNLKLWCNTYLSIQVLRFAQVQPNISTQPNKGKDCRIENKLIKSPWHD